MSTKQLHPARQNKEQTVEAKVKQLRELFAARDEEIGKTRSRMRFAS